MKKPLIFLAVLIIGLAITNKIVSSNPKGVFSLPNWREVFQPKPTQVVTKTPESKPFVLSPGSEEEKIISTIDAALPSVVTVGINFTTQERGSFEFDPSNPYGFRQVPGRSREVDQNIGSGFIVSEDGLIITNKHVVAQQDATYKIRFNSGDTVKVEQIYRDPLNDLAILKVSAESKLQALSLGESDNLKLGQTTIAIGTPLGEFTNSVTKGIISGLGRGITAGSPFEGFVEKLDNVIQTDTPISPGNSGGPLLNSSGQVIGINTAVSSEGENIGFAIPVNIIKTLLQEFEKRGGSFERPYIGVQYQMIDRKTAIANGLVEGAYVMGIVADSPAEKAGIQEEDVIIKIDGVKVVSSDEQSITKILLDKKIGQTVQITIWRDGDEKMVSVVLEKFYN
jgi:serine protease Do